MRSVILRTLIVTASLFLLLSQKSVNTPNEAYFTAKVLPAADLAADQPGTFQRLDVLRGRRQRHLVRLGQLANGAFAFGEFAQHLAARGVAQCVKDRVERGRI